MTLQQQALLLACTCLYLATLIAATVPAHVHEARQGTISVDPLSAGPGPESIRTSSSTSTTPEATTMSPTPTSEPSSSSSSSDSSLPSSTSSNTSSYSSSSGTLASPSSSVTSSATPQPTSSPGSLNFTVHNMTTCSSGLISWNYSGEETDLLLSITNIGVPQNDDLLRIGTRDSTVNGAIQQQLVDTKTSAQSWIWASVNLTQGWYEIQGLVLSTPTVSNNSTPFFITNRADVSCLTGTSPQASSSASASSSALPSSAALATNPDANVGSIVGGVIGVVFGVTLAIVAGACFWLRRRKRSFNGRSGGKDRKWGSLKSTTSSMQPDGSGTQFTSNHFHAHSESTGAILQDIASGKASTTTTPGGSDEDVIVVNEEKLVSPASSSGMSPFDVLNTPVHYDRRASTYSMQTPISIACERSRVPSIRASAQSLEQQAQRIRSSMETSIRRRSERLSMPTLPPPALSRFPHSPTHAQPNEEYPLTTVTPTPVNRSISAGAVSMTARRTSRKPVPHYDSSMLVEDKNADSVSMRTAGADSSQSHGTALGTGAHGTPSDLVHKASFGDGRPVHYLIPDMPLPQQD